MPPSTNARRRRIDRLIAVLLLSLPAAGVYPAGLTVITHGQQFNASGPPAWVFGMQEALEARAAQESAALGGPDPLVSVAIAQFEFDLQTPRFFWVLDQLAASPSGEVILIIDWSQIEADPAAPVSAEEIADALIPTLVDAASSQGLPLFTLPVHFIAHSRGSPLNARLAEFLGSQGVWVEQFTTLDPHPANFGLGNLGDRDVLIFSNVIFADNYWRADGGDLFKPERAAGITPFETDQEDLDGRPLPGTFDRNLDRLDNESDPDNGFDVEHADVHLWYHGSIDVDVLNDVTDGGSGVITPAMRDNSDWWTPADQQGRATGFFYSRLIGGPRPATGLHPDHPDGDPINFREGVALADDTPGRPNVQFENLSGQWTYTVGDTINLRYIFQDLDSDITVAFFRDADRSPLNGTPRRLLGMIPNAFDPALRSGEFSYQPDATDIGVYFISVQASDGQTVRHYTLEHPFIIQSPGIDAWQLF